MSEDVFVLLSDLSNQTRVTKAILAPESNDLEPVDPGSRKIIIIDILAGIREKVFTMESVSVILFVACPTALTRTSR